MTQVQNSAPLRSQRVMIIVGKWKKSATENGGKWYTNHNPQTEDCIYCLSDKDDPFPIRFGKILDIVAACAPGAHIYLFWHRTSSYDSKEVGKILEKLKEVNPEKKVECFLFGQGSDFIYIGINEKGLLSSEGSGGEGSFGGIRQENGKDKLIQVVMNEPDRIINYLHFESIWSYYSHLFKARIFDLKEDLLLHFYGLWFGDQIANPLLLADCLRENENLYRRLKAFAHGLSEKDHAEIIKEKDETKRHNNKQKNSEVSRQHDDLYVLDNCLPNLQSIYGREVANAYIELSELIKANIFEVSMFSNDKISPYQKLREIRSGFRKLLQTMPEEAYY